MNRYQTGFLSRLGGPSFLAGVVLTVCFAAYIPLPSLRGSYVVSFLAYFLIAAAAYALAVARLNRDRLPLTAIWVFAILFRLILLGTDPTLSDDVYRYIWDGHLLNQGINPFSLPVNSPLLDQYDTLLRGLVNHDWMASPYLPVSQLFFALVNRVAPQSILAFQVGAVIFDLSTGWLVFDILRMLGLSRNKALIYLWNPLVIVEFAHGAHIDALMIFLMMAAFWFLVRSKPWQPGRDRECYFSAFALAGSTLTKAIPALLVPLFVRRWGWRRLVVYFALLLSLSALFAAGAGWGLSGPLDGRGLFGALRIYSSYWNYNSGIYHWFEVLILGSQAAGATSGEMVGDTPILFAKLFTIALTALISLASGVWAWKLDDPGKADFNTRSVYLLRLTVIPIGAYLLLTTTVHPWYVTLIVPLLPFLYPVQDETNLTGRFVWPWIYFSIAVSLSYLTYIDPQNLREYPLVRLLEYLPLYLLFIWASMPLFHHRLGRIFATGNLWERIKRR
ncbi:MAG: polyprenol phosphomannose-dependent alpha 1,6 mannosyltransferase MptB [Anaerolineales bacterium]